jgi:hypothetical protein
MTDWWHTRQWRLVQTNLREIDMLDIHAEQVAADLKDFSANVLMINAAGIIASYPTRLPFHFQSPYLQGDSLKDILRACHEAGIRVIARTDFSKVRRPIYEAHPEWAYISPQGKIVDYNGDVHVCPSGAYQQEYMPLILQELLDTHDFDGIFFNMGGYVTRDYSGISYGICQCAACQQQFKAMFGLSLPTQENPHDPVFRKYTLFRWQMTRLHHEKMYRFLSERWPHLCIANHPESGRGFIRQESNTAIDRPLPHWQYSASDNTRWAVGSYPQMVCSNTTVDFIDYPYRHVAVSPHQQALRLAQNLANGGALDYYLIGRLDNHEDRSGYALIQEIFRYHAAHEETYTDLRSQADALLLKALGDHEGEYRGWFRILAENHFLFDVARVEAAANLPLERYRVVIAPGAAGIDDALAALLDNFVTRGGVLVAAGACGFYDENMEAREAPALRCLGIEQVLQVRPDMRSTYFKFVEKYGFRRFDTTDLVYKDGAYIYARYAAGAHLHMRLVPPHRFGPPERCYYEQVTEHPGFVTHPFGKGKAVYLPWLPGELFHRQGHTNTADFCADLLEGVVGLRPVGGEIPPAVEVTLHEKADGSCQLLHLVNGSGHFGNTFYAPIPMNGVRVELPASRPVRAVMALRSGQTCAFSQHGQAFTLHVPRLELFEAVKIIF